ncbi:ABC transporter ATP-binding protein [Achromobacter insolitus]|uniref:ABC transporter ATP-binding protein n=1 Tax=Achromobacter insolitus TaxID=217204 RepID=UPI0007C86981|nr:ABC transporter ATP-binding protein [Achromobacter insolitus]OAE51254.1 ABC transporter ATP-binding protein [Achromobacter insolitus]OCZ52225.1 ABC transporter ATP-binding protein [Achromobacter insolitus]
MTPQDGATHQRGAAPAAARARAIGFSGMSIRFNGDVQALDDVSLDIAPGEFVSIVGPSGCGKTTLLNIAAGLIPAKMYEGRCEVLGKLPVAGNRDVAYMLARDALCPWRTALANVELAGEIRGQPMPRRREVARALLASVGLGAFEQSYPKELSHGMRQRVALARTFSMDSPILLMDEPFGALDSLTKIQLEEVLLELWQAQARTVMFVTHDLGEAVAVSDRVIVMSARPGRIVADVRIDLPRPRSVKSLQKDPAFHRLHAQVWEKLDEAMGN